MDNKPLKQKKKEKEIAATNKKRAKTRRLLRMRMKI